jgi:hypothetical protein
MFYGKKVLILETEGDCYDCGGSDQVKVTVVEDAKTFVAQMAQELANNIQAMDALLANEQFKKALDQRGFRDLAKCRKIADRAVLENRYYICNFGSGSYPHMREVDIENVSTYEAEDLSKKDTMLFQSVGISTLKKNNPKAYKAYQKAEEAKNKRAKAAAEKKAAKKEQQRQKEIEAAKRLLEEAGELDTATTKSA